MRNLGYPEIKVGGPNVNILRYTDDTILIAQKEDLQRLLDIVEDKN